MKKIFQIILISFVLISASGCVSTVVGGAVDLTIEVVKVPFKVAGAAVDIVTGDDD